MFVSVYDAFARDFARYCKEFEMADAQKLTKAERDVIVEALEFKQRSLERAAKATSGAISKAYDEAAGTVGVLVVKFRNLSLEL